MARLRTLQTQRAQTLSGDMEQYRDIRQGMWEKADFSVAGIGEIMDLRCRNLPERIELTLFYIKNIVLLRNI